MDWNYSNPLSEALLASRNNQTNLFQKPYFSSYDPLIAKYPNRPSYINRSNLYDDIDELALKVETENLLTSRYRPINHLSYVPSYFNKNNQTSLEENNYTNEFYDERFNDNNNNNNNSNSNKNNNVPSESFPVRLNKIPQQPPKNNNKNENSPNLKNNRNNNNNNNNNNSNNNNNNNLQSQQRNKFRESESDFGQVPIQAHNSEEQRFLQYQQRIANQQQQNNYPVQFQQNEFSLSELEILKLKQQQDRQQLMASLGQKQIQSQNNFQQQATPFSNQNIYAPFFQPNYLKTHKQYSEASIPSTNADPLNSNNPTPPLFAQREQNRKNQLRISDDDPGSYVNALKETRLREQRLAKGKYTTTDYKRYQKNFGFGKDFLPFESETKEEKMEKAKKREDYAKFVKERNLDKYAYNDNIAFLRRTQNQKFDLDFSTNKRRNKK